MITEDKFREILNRLLEKSKSGKVNWQVDVYNNTEFHVYFDPTTRLEVGFDSPESEPDWAYANLVADEKQAATLRSEDDSDDFILLKDLYRDAQRCLYRWDQVLDSIDKVLSEDKTIGMSPEGNIPS